MEREYLAPYFCYGVKMSVYFYCYSVKLKDFLKSMGFRYESKAENRLNGRPYFTFLKSEELTKAILLWNDVKIKK